MEKRTGIAGLTGAFRDAFEDIGRGDKVVFAGSVAVCTPFAELLAYAIRDKEPFAVYLPRADIGLAKKMRWIENIGYSVVDERGDPNDPNAIVILGGLAMPKFGCSTSEVNKMIHALSGEKKPKLIGVCFMNVFKKTGWGEQVPFDAVIDATMEVTLR